MNTENQEKLPRVSRDEMNLAEFPLTVLSTRSDPSIKTLEFSDTITGKSGDTIQRKWTITGADKFGLPTASDDEVLLGLLKLSVDKGFESPKIFFTRYELLKTLQWTTEGRSYSRLQKALDRLSGVRIKAANAFYDNANKKHSTVNFGIIDAYELNDGKGNGTQPSFFTWSDVLYNSFQVGFIKKLDLGFYLGLESAVSKRLFRYLDKHFWYKSKITINVFVLAHEKLGISRNYAYLSSIKQQLDPALNELIGTGFLHSFQYDGKGEGATLTVSAASRKPRALEGKRIEEQVTAANQTNSEQSLASKLLDRGLKGTQIDYLLTGKDDVQLRKIERIVTYYDLLVKKKSHLVSKSPIGFLYKAIERYESFTLPGEQQDFKYHKNDAGSVISHNTGVRAEMNGRVTGAKMVAIDPRGEYLTARKYEAEELKQNAEPEMLAKLRSEVAEKISNLRGVISKEKFEHAVEVGVEENLLKLFAFPKFEDWLKEKGRGRKAAA